MKRESKESLLEGLIHLESDQFLVNFKNNTYLNWKITSIQWFE